jgi:hypothetical protein
VVRRFCFVLRFGGREEGSSAECVRVIRTAAVVRLDEPLFEIRDRGSRPRARVVATMDRRFFKEKKKPRIPLHEVIVVEGRTGDRLAMKVTLHVPR